MITKNNYQQIHATMENLLRWHSNVIIEKSQKYRWNKLKFNILKFEKKKQLPNAIACIDICDSFMVALVSVVKYTTVSLDGISRMLEKFNTFSHVFFVFSIHHIFFEIKHNKIWYIVVLWCTFQSRKRFHMFNFYPFVQWRYFWEFFFISFL